MIYLIIYIIIHSCVIAVSIYQFFTECKIAKDKKIKNIDRQVQAGARLPAARSQLIVTIVFELATNFCLWMAYQHFK